MVTCSQGEDVAFLEGHPSACYVHTYLSWHKYLETVWYRNEKGIYTGNSQEDSLRFSAGMLAHQLLTRLQKDKKIGVGVQRTETKPFLYSYCIFYLIMQLLIFFLQTMYECIKWSQKIGLAKYLTLWMWKLFAHGMLKSGLFCPDLIHNCNCETNLWLKVLFLNYSIMWLLVTLLLWLMITNI